MARERERAGGEATPACPRPGCPLGRAGADREARAVGPCIYHPKKPQFRDGWKVWPCCGRGSRDWEALMAIPGCAEAPECLPEGPGGWEGAGVKSTARKKSQTRESKFDTSVSNETTISERN